MQQFSKHCCIAIGGTNMSLRLTAGPVTEDRGSAPAGAHDTGSVGLGDITREAFLFLGAGSTVILQLAEPGVGHGVADHSTTLDRPLDRLRTTMTYIYAVTLGTEDERRRVVRMVNKAHVPVRSATYNAFDPELQLWVAATLYHGAVDLHERFHGPLDDASADRVYREAAIYGTALQVREDMWPQDRHAFRAYWTESLDNLSVDAEVRHYVRQLLRGGRAPRPIRAATGLNRVVTIGLLPPQLREALALPWSDRDQRRFDRLMTVLPPVYNRMPVWLRTLPSRYYLRDMRRRLAAHRHVI